MATTRDLSREHHPDRLIVAIEAKDIQLWTVCAAPANEITARLVLPSMNLVREAIFGEYATSVVIVLTPLFSVEGQGRPVCDSGISITAAQLSHVSLMT